MKLATRKWCHVWLIVRICHDEGTCEVVVDPLVHGLHYQTQPTPTVGRHIHSSFVLLVEPKVVVLWLKVGHSEGPGHTVFETSLDLASQIGFLLALLTRIEAHSTNGLLQSRK